MWYVVKYLCCRFKTGRSVRAFSSGIARLIKAVVIAGLLKVGHLSMTAVTVPKEHLLSMEATNLFRLNASSHKDNGENEPTGNLGYGLSIGK